MKVLRLLPGIATLSAVWLAQICHASQPTPTNIFEHKLELVSHSDGPGPAELQLTCVPAELCSAGEELSVEIFTYRGLQFLGEQKWRIEASDENPYSTILRVIIPPNDTSAIGVRMRCGRLTQTIHRYFVTTGDTLEYWWTTNPSYIRHKRRPVQPDTTKYEIILDLSNKLHYDFLKKYEEQLGPLIETGLPDFYRFQATKETIRELRMERFPIALLKKGDGTTPEDLMQAEFTVQLDVGDSAKLSSAEDVLGNLSEDRQPGKYLLKTTFENLLNLHKKGIHIQLIDKDTTKSLGGIR